MTEAVDLLLQSALKLPDDDQLALLAALRSAVEERGLRPFDDSWREEIARRSAEYDAGQVQPIPWSQVEERARLGLADHG
jgi:putative addiction module component (TIGR02574 family)